MADDHDDFLHPSIQINSRHTDKSCFIAFWVLFLQQSYVIYVKRQNNVPRWNGRKRICEVFVKFFSWFLMPLGHNFAATNLIINPIEFTIMKTSFLKSALLAAALFIISPIHAWDPMEIAIRIQLSLADIHPDPYHPRTPPIEAPQVGQTDHTLYFLDGTALILNIYSVDEGGNEALEYTTAVSATTTEVQLPNSLSGTYIIEVVRDGLYFRGEIEL